MLTKKDYALIELIAEYRILTIDQISILTNIGQRAAQKRVSKLAELGVLEISSRTLHKLKGRPENMYSVSQSGAKQLLQRGILPQTTQMRHITAEGIYHHEHELLLNWFRIHLLNIERHIPDLSIDFISSKSPFVKLRHTGHPLIADEVEIDKKNRIFIPDGVFSIASSKQKKRLLFFLEVDMSTESRLSSTDRGDTISQKLRNYHKYFLTNGYKRYQRKWNCQLNGFRLLFLTNTPERAVQLSRFVQRNQANNFIWIGNQERMNKLGLAGKIWARGGNSESLESILGPTLNADLPLPDLK